MYPQKIGLTIFLNVNRGCKCGLESAAVSHNVRSSKFHSSITCKPKQC